MLVFAFDSQFEIEYVIYDSNIHIIIVYILKFVNFIASLNLGFGINFHLRRVIRVIRVKRIKIYLRFTRIYRIR